MIDKGRNHTIEEDTIHHNPLNKEIGIKCNRNINLNPNFILVYPSLIVAIEMQTHKNESLDNAMQCQGSTWDKGQEWPLEPVNVPELLIFAVYSRGFA